MIYEVFAKTKLRFCKQQNHFKIQEKFVELKVAFVLDITCFASVVMIHVC